MPFVSSFQFLVLSIPSLAILHHSRCLHCLSLLQVPSPSVCGLFRSVLFLGGLVSSWVVSLLFLFALYVLLRLFVCLCYAISTFFFLALHPGSSPFRFFTGFLLSSLLVGVVPFLISVFLTVRPSCLVWGFSPLLSFAILPFSSMRCFFVSFHSSSFLPSGCLFPLDPFGFRAFSFVSGLFCWALLLLSSLSSHLVCFAIGLFLSLLVPGSPLLVFSPPDVVGAFVYALSQVVLFLVFRHCPSGSCPSGGDPWCFFCGAVISLTCVLGFCAMPVSSFTPLPRLLRTLLGAFVGVLSRLLCCVLSILGVFLLVVLMLFFPVLIRFCFSSFSFSNLF